MRTTRGPDVPHAIDARGLEVVLLFIEPESEIGARLRAGLKERPVHEFSLSEERTLRDGLPSAGSLDSSTVDAWMRRALAASPQHSAPPMHPRVRRVIRRLRTGELPFEKLSLERLAEVAGLSPSRFMHAFTESIGVPVRPYLLWLRLQLAAGEIASGARIGEAAHRAGFSDAAHLSRTFRRMFGTPASALVRRGQFVQARRVGDAAP
jgi:AraC-like DNA-binding protein